MAERRAAPEAGKPAPKRLRRRRLRRRLLIGAGVVVLLLVVFVALIPTLAGRMLPGRLERALNDSIQGRAQVAGASFSWMSGQRIGPITIDTPSGERVADLTLDVERGLLSLARAGLGLGQLDLGRARLTGVLHIERAESGELNVEDLAAPTTTPTAPGPTTRQSVRIPQGLTVAFIVESLEVRFIDRAKMREGAPAAVILLPDLSGQLAISDASSATVSLTSELRYSAAPGEQAKAGGSFSISGSVAQLTDSAGFVRPEQMAIDVRAQAKDVALAIADTFSGMESQLASAMGERLQADFRAQGSLENATATVEVVSRSLAATAAVDISDRVVTMTKPARLTAEGPAVVALVPGLAAQLQSRGDVRFEQLPNVEASLDQVRLRIPAPGQPFDLRGTSFRAQLNMTEASGRLVTGGEQGAPGVERAFTVAPVTAMIATSDLGEAISIQAQTSTTIEGNPAGQVNVDLVARRPLDDAGQLRGDLLGRIEGAAEVDNFTTAIADPFVSALGLDLSRDVGPTLDLELRARPVAGAAGASPGTELTLNVQSENLRAAADLVYSGDSLRSRERGVLVEMNRAAPLLSAMLADAGARVDTAGPISVSATDLRVDLARLRGEGGTDLGALGGQLRIEAGPTGGQIVLPGREAQAFGLAPISASVDARQIAQRVQVRASTSATLGGEPAGTLNVDMVATELLDASGGISQAPAINGRATLQNVATRVAQPWAEAMGVDLPAGVGPQLSLSLAASSAEDAGRGRVTNLDVAVRSPGFTGDALMTLAQGELRSRGNGARFVLRDIGAAVRPAAERSGLSVSQGGTLRIDAGQFSVPLAGEGMLQRAAGNVQVTVAGLTVQPPPPAAEPGGPAPAPAAPVTVQQIVATTTLTPGAPARLQLRGSGSHENAPFVMQGDLQIPGLVDDAPLRPLGSLEIRNLPTTLTALIPGLSAGGEGLGPMQLTREIAGRSLSLNFSSTRPQGAPVHARNVTLTVDSAGLKGSAGMQLTDQVFEMRQLDIRARLPESLVAMALDSVSTGLASRPRLEGPGTFHVTATPFSIPLGGGARPDLQRAGNATFRLALEGTTVIRNIQIAQEQGPARDVGPMALQNIGITAEVPISSLIAGGEAGEARASLTGAVLSGPEQRVLDLGGSATLPLRAGRPAGDLRADVQFAVLDTRVVDELMNQRGLLADGVGETARVTAGVIVQFEQAPPAREGEEQGFPAVGRTVVTAAIDSPNLRTREPLELERLPDRFSLVRKGLVTWRMQPAFANWYLLRAGDVNAEQQELVRFVSPTDLTLRVTRLALANGPGQGPMAPGVFGLEAQVSASAAVMAIQQERAQFSGLRASLTGGREPGTIGFAVQIQDAGGGPALNNEPAVQLSGGIYSVADQDGNVTPALALISARGGATAFPTALIDAMARQDGLLLEALGPQTNLNLDARSFSMAGGNISVTMTSTRAVANLSGTMHEGTLILREEARVELREVTPALGARASSVIPLLGQFEKGQGQQPAVITARNMTIPLDGNIANLNGDITFDPGEATFTTSNVFAQMLRAAGQRSAGIIGRRIEPFRATVRNGAITYERFTLPLGEFTVQTQGTVNLATRRLDVVTYVPFGALSDEAAGALNTGLGRLLGGALPTVERATMVPIRTSGSLTSPDTKPDVQLFVQQAGRTLLRPDQLIGGSIQDLFQNLDKRLSR